MQTLQVALLIMQHCLEQGRIRCSLLISTPVTTRTWSISKTPPSKALLPQVIRRISYLFRAISLLANSQLLQAILWALISRQLEWENRTLNSITKGWATSWVYQVRYPSQIQGTLLPWSTTKTQKLLQLIIALTGESSRIKTRLW